MRHVTCLYCAHRNAGSELKCANCGAPLEEARAERHSSPPAAQETKTADHVVESAVAEATSLERKLAARSYPREQWVAALVGIVAVALTGFLIATSCSGGGGTKPIAENVSSVGSLPGSLRQAAVCTPYDTAEHSEKCVVRSDNALLWGDIAGGRDLTFYVAVANRDRLAQIIGTWRAGGGTILSDSPIFTEIGLSSNVMFADTRTGFHLDTGTFTDTRSAQLFLSRAGLAN